MLRNPMLYVAFAYAFFVWIVLLPAGCPPEVGLASLVGMFASAIVALVAGIMQDRAHPSAKRTWRISLVILCILVIGCWFWFRGLR